MPLAIEVARVSGAAILNRDSEALDIINMNKGTIAEIISDTQAYIKRERREIKRSLKKFRSVTKGGL